MTGNETRRGAAARFVDVYKWVYLLAILVNLFLMTRDQMSNWGTSQYVTNASVFLANLGAWWFFRRGNGWAYLAERTLSVGRMAMCCAVGSILFLFIVGLSPVALVLWIPLIGWLGRSNKAEVLTVWWGTCLALLALEVCYYRSLRAARRAAGIEWLT